jgi:hypothetical protein
MKVSSLRPRIALLVAICYLALAVGLPFLHRHGLPCAPPRASVHRVALVHGSAGSEDSCPSCQWDRIAKAAPPALVLWTQAERLATRFQLPRAEDHFSPISGLPTSRAPPLPSLGS